MRRVLRWTVRGLLLVVVLAMGALLTIGRPLLFGPKARPVTARTFEATEARLARGEYLVIYDAEDRPEREQLRRAYAAFRAGPPNLATVQAQLRARFVYDADSVTDVAHQLGYFATIDRWHAWPEVFTRLAAVTVDAMHAAARRYLAADNRTIGVFEPTPAEPS